MCLDPCWVAACLPEFIISKLHSFHFISLPLNLINKKKQLMVQPLNNPITESYKVLFQNQSLTTTFYTKSAMERSPQDICIALLSPREWEPLPSKNFTHQYLLRAGWCCFRLL